MPQKGLLQKKREELELIAAISTQPDAELARLIEDGNVEAVAEHYKFIRDSADALLLRTLQKCVGTIERQATWDKLSDRPAEFDAFLAKILKATERCLKLLHRIPDHRPTKQAERDQRLEDLRKEFPDASWGQLANKYNGRFAKEDEGNQIDAKIAERAQSTGGTALKTGTGACLTGTECCGVVPPHCFFDKGRRNSSAATHTRNHLPTTHLG